MKHLSIFHTLLILLFTVTLGYGQRSGQIPVPMACSGTDVYLNYYIAQLDKCDELIDISVELSGVLMERMRNNDCSVTTIDVITQTDGMQTITIGRESETTVSFFNLSRRQESIMITLRGRDRRGGTVFEIPIRHSTRKTGEIVVSESFMAQLFDMGHIGANPLAPATVGPKGDVFTYWCGRRMNMVTLLAFYQDFLGLSEAQVCRIIQLFERYNLQYTSIQALSFTGIYCQLLWEFWDDYIAFTSGNGGTSGEEGGCECNVINSTVFINHSIGAATGQQLENCPEVSITEDHRVWSHEGTQPRTQKEQNWAVSKWAYMGAAKSLYTITHHYEGGDEDYVGMKKNLPNSILKSSITLAMKCFEPHNAAISDDCECEKSVITSAQYNSNIDGVAGTDGNIISSGNGRVKSCMEDFAFFTRWSREGFELLESGAASTCVECESSDTTNFLTDLGQLAGEIEGIAPTILDTNGVDFTNIDDILLGAGSIVDLVDNFLSSIRNCGASADTSYQLLNAADNYTLTPQNDFVTYIVSSRAYTRTDFENDESWSELHLISNYFLASGLESEGDSTCCNELVGAYSIGHLGAFTEGELATVSGDNANFAGFEFKIKEPLQSGSWLEYGGLYQQGLVTLEHLQVEVALLFAAITPNFLMDVFGIDCPPGCTTGVDCYYNCGYWGDCHEDDVAASGLVAAFTPPTGQNGIETPPLNFIPTTDVRIYPNPISDGLDLEVRWEEENQYEALFIFNAQGQLISEQSINDGQLQLSIQPEMLQQGLNMVVMKRKDGSLYVDQIVKH
ncbi:MAG: T9SS type A sorting domain-containing protein [Bacteroidota bacterium]